MRAVFIVKITFLFVLLLTGCQPEADISGKISDADTASGKVYLINPGTFRAIAATYFGKVIDSAVIDEDGHFAFYNLPESNRPVVLELSLKQPGMAPNYLHTEDPSTANFMPVIWQTGESLIITANSKQFQSSFSVENPSPVNQALLDLRDISQQAYKTYLSAKSWDVEDSSELMKKEDALLNYQNALIDFANNTPYYLPAIVATRWASPDGNYERIPELLVTQCEKWQEMQPDQPWVKELCKLADPADLPVLIGDVFPNLNLPLLSKDTIKLYDELGKHLTIIDLWASWCAPCRKENRNVLVPLWDEYFGHGLQIIAYGLESDETAWKKAVAKDGAGRWLQASDLQGDAPPFLKKIRVRTIPANFILNEKGEVIAKNVHGEALVDFVETYLNAK